MKRLSIAALALALVVGVLATPGDTTATVGNSITSPDTGGIVGEWTSLALDAGGNPVVSYYDATNADLKVLHCGDPDCTSGNSISSPDTGGDVGSYTSLALDSAGNPVVSYYDASNGHLKVLHCNDPNCDSGVNGPESITSPDTSDTNGKWTSLALDAGGNPVVSYLYVTDPNWHWHLKVLHCGDPNCTSGNRIAAPDTADNIGTYSSLALDASGNPVVSYHWFPQYGQGDLKVLHCDDANCDGDESANITSPDTGWTGLETSLEFDASGNPVISYWDLLSLDLKVLHCGDPNCTSGNSIASPSHVGSFSDPSLELDASGNPVVSYLDEANGDLELLHCGDPNCTSGNTFTSPDEGGDVGEYSSLALDSSGNPVVSYYDATNGDLKVLHCGNPNCAGLAVGGIAELPNAAGSPLEAPESSRPNAGLLTGIAAAATAGVVVLMGAAWYARRRWL